MEGYFFIINLHWRYLLLFSCQIPTNKNTYGDEFGLQKELVNIMVSVVKNDMQECGVMTNGRLADDKVIY